MKPRDFIETVDEAEPLWDDASEPQAAGPQGTALILELQRLRQAFEPDEPYAARQAPGRGGRQPHDRVNSTGYKRQPKRKPKGKIGRTVDGWLEQFGFSSVEAPAPAARQREPQLSRAPRQPPTITIDPRLREKAAPARGGPRSSSSRSSEPPSRTPAPVVRPQPSDHRAPRPNEKPALPARRSPSPVPSPRRELAIATNQLQSTTALGRAIERSRNSLFAGVSFLVERDALADNDNAPGDSLVVRTGRAYNRELRTGLRALIIGVVLGGGWLTLVPLAGAVVVQGTLVVQSNVKTIQHPTGGVVAQIPVQNGMRVKAGDLLLRLDPTQAQASLETVSKQLDDARARIARLVAERDGLDRPGIPPEFSARMNEDSIKAILASEESLFKARYNTHQSQRQLLENRVAQLGEEIKGLNSQIESKGKELELISSELTGVQELYDKRLVPLTRLTTLQRDRTRIEGERGQLTSSIAETRAKIGEAQLQIVKIDQDLRSDVVKELGETQGKEAELEQKAVSARDIISRIDIRAPTSGLVHQLVAHTIGGVIKAGDPIMEIVPDSDDLQIEAKLDPKDIDQVRKGQKAFVRFSAFNARVTPQLAGDVSYVSADTSKETQGTQPFYTVRVTLPEEERRKIDGEPLISGMPAEVFMQTGSRTMMSYLFKPIMEQLSRAFVER